MAIPLTHESIVTFQESLSAKGRSSATVKAYVAALNGLERWLHSSNNSRLPFEVAVPTYLNKFREGYGRVSASTTQQRLSAFRAYAEFFGEPRLFADYKPPKVQKGKPHPIPEGVEGIRRMLGGEKDHRKRALIAMIGLCGMRVTEARTLRRDDVDLVNMELSIYGKGDKERVVPLTQEAWEWIKPAYIDAGLTICPMSDKTARRAFKAAAERVGLASHPTHDGRATLATGMLNNGANLRVVQEMLGHASPTTTEIYTQVTMNDMRKAATFS